ncbi:MAG: hypothetical protein PHO50_07820 [Aminobacterium colombiense]|nr:hypothetical protein [Aminobacterium colombiense]
MKIRNKLSLILLFVMAVALSAVIAVSFMTTEPDSRSAHFWMTLFFLLLGVVFSFLFGLLQIRIDLDKGLPTPAFFSLGTLIVLYDLFLIVNPLLFWKGFEFSVTGYAITHIIGLATFLSLSGTTLMAAVSITAREKQEKKIFIRSVSGPIVCIVFSVKPEITIWMMRYFLNFRRSQGG